MNKVILMGRLTKDPELKYTSGNNTYMDNRIQKYKEQYYSMYGHNPPEKCIESFCKMYGIKPGEEVQNFRELSQEEQEEFFKEGLE